MSNIKFTDTLEVTASHGRLAKAAQIYDDEQKATQAALNKKFLDYTPGTDFANVFDEQAPDISYVLDDLIENNVKAGRVIRNVNSAFFIADENGKSRYFDTGSLFLVTKTPVKGDDINSILLPLIVSPFTLAGIAHDINNANTNIGALISRISALEARLKI